MKSRGRSSNYSLSIDAGVPRWYPDDDRYLKLRKVQVTCKSSNVSPSISFSTFTLGQSKKCYV